MYYHVAIRLWWMSSTLTLCGRMIIASTNYQTGHSGVAFATLAAYLWVILGRPVVQKIEWEKAKKGPILWLRFATAALSSQTAPANYDEMRLLGLHIACQYGVHINIACIQAVARIDFGGCSTPQKVDLLDQKRTFWTSPPYPPTKTSFLAHFVAKSGPFARFGGMRAPPWLRAFLYHP